MFFTESRYYVTVSSVTSPGHVADIYVYTAPSVGRHDDDVITCGLAKVYYNDKALSEEAWPFALSPGNDHNYYNYDNNTVSLYVKPRDVAAVTWSDPGLHVVTIVKFVGYYKVARSRTTRCYICSAQSLNKFYYTFENELQKRYL